MTATHTVLFVDDEVEILESLRRTVRNEPYRVVTTTSPLEALSRIEAGGIDLVVADIDMPEMTGLTLVARVRREHPDVVRILLTGGASVESAIDSINQGEVYRYLTKPWEAAELRDVLREALARLDELRRGALASRREQVEQMLRNELAAQHPGILTPPSPDGVHTLDLDRLMALLLQIHSPLLDAADDDREAAPWSERTTTPGPLYLRRIAGRPPGEG